MAIARDGYVLIAVATAAALAAFVAAALLDSRLLWVLAYASVILALLVAFLFRDPDRAGERGANLILAPADGRVSEVEDVDEARFIGGPAKRVSILLGLLDVPVQRSPVAGTVAYEDDAWFGVDSGRFRVLVSPSMRGRGRVVMYARRGERVDQGDRIGMVRFGARVDTFVPRATGLRVRPGERVFAGRTVIGELPQAAS